TAVKLWTVGFALAAACGTPTSNALAPPGPGPTTKARTAPAGAAMEVTYQDLPDDRWRHAAEVAFASWNAFLTRRAPARVVVRAWRDPDGGLVPYLVRGELLKADGSPDYALIAAVLGDRLFTSRGPAAATEFLAAIGFPAHRISLGHLL